MIETKDQDRVKSELGLHFRLAASNAAVQFPIEATRLEGVANYIEMGQGDWLQAMIYVYSYMRELLDSLPYLTEDGEAYGATVLLMTEVKAYIETEKRKHNSPTDKMVWFFLARR